MKKILYSLLIFASATLFAQKNPNVKFAVSGDAVGTVSMFDSKKEFIQSVNTFKASVNLPQNLKKFGYLSENGLAEIKFKKNFGPLDTMLVSQLNEQYGLPKDNSIFIEGYEFSPATKIYSDMLVKSEVKDYNGKKTLFVTTTQN